EHADWVLAKKQQYRYESLAHGRPVVGLGVRLWSLLQRWMVGYGYRPVRAVALLLLLLIAGSFWFGLRDDDCVHDPDLVVIEGSRCVVNQDDTGLDWNPVLYTVDLLVPIVDFGNKGRWYMADEDKWVATAFTATGWVLATTVAAGMTRTLRRTNSGCDDLAHVHRREPGRAGLDPRRRRSATGLRPGQRPGCAGGARRRVRGASLVGRSHRGRRRRPVPRQEPQRFPQVEHHVDDHGRGQG